MSITNLTSPYSTQYQVSSDDIDLVKIRSKETSPLTHEDLDDNFANLMNKVNALVDIIGGSSAAISVDEDGNVGIGTTNPALQLQIKNQSTTSDKVQIGLTSLDGTQNASITHIDQVGAERLSLSCGGFNLEQLTLINNGNVGIGNDNPSHDLTLGSATSTGTTSERLKIYRGQDDSGQNLEMGFNHITVTRDANTLADPQSTFAIKQRGSDGERTAMHIDTAGNVGIGTVNPLAKLHVKLGANGLPEKNASLDTATALRVVGGDNAVIDMGSSGASGTWIQSRNQSTYNLQYDLLLQPLGGNVGIGTGATIPSAKLHIEDTNANLPGIKISSSDQDYEHELRAGGDGMIISADSTNYGGVGPDIRLMVSGSEHMRIIKNGNVGIGTSNPGAKLNIIDAQRYSNTPAVSASGQLRLSNISTNGGTWGIHTTADAWNAGGGGKLGFFADDNSNNARMMITQAGNVGIGTTDPGSFRLKVEGGNLGAERITSLVSTDGTSSECLYLANTTTEEPFIRFNAKNSSNGINWSIGVDDESLTDEKNLFTFKRWDDANTLKDTPFVIDSNGNVGIGTTDPIYALDVQDISSLDTGQGLRIRTRFEGLASNALLVKNEGGSGDTYFVVGNNGNVGIGTATPDFPLDIVKKDVGVQLQMGRSDSNSGSAWMGADSNGFHLGVGAYGSGNNVSGPKGITVDTDGNFGIGTVSPGSNAGGSTLNPGNAFGGKIVHIDNDAGAASLAIGSSTQATLIMVEADAPADEKYKALRARDGKFQLINLRDDSSLKNIPLTCDSDGNVGIGTTTPNATDWNANSTTLHIHQNDTNGGILKVESLNTTAILSAGNNQAQFGTVEAQPLRFYTSSNPRMTIKSDGTVGIGTTNPSSTLQVVGSLSKSSGSFRIDHPVKPETHDLVHSFVEAPQADNIYRGKVDLMNGKAEVDIDAVAGMTEGTFVALNREIQVFTSNETDWSAVRGRVDGNKLIIDSKNNQSTATISWLVIGERKDKHMYDTEWTDENGKVIVEPLKPEPIPEPEISPEPEPEPYVAEDIIAKDGKEYIRIGDKDYEVLGKNEDGSLLLDDDVTNNG